MEFKEKYAELASIINSALDGYMVKTDCLQGRLYGAMRYSLESGGKRLRPVIMLAVFDMYGENFDKVLPFACAIEMIHTYSLIHDDLPAIDNDDIRRGRPSNHKAYGEAMALFAGDALLNYAFQIMSDFSLEKGQSYEPNVRAMSIIAKASGADGMLGGQAIDIECQGEIIDEKVLKAMYKYKTGALFEAAIHASAVLCGASGQDIRYLLKYSEHLGLAFQVQDDILDVEEDKASDKSTFVSVFGLELAKSKLVELTKKSLEALNEFGQNADFLRELANSLSKRQV